MSRHQKFWPALITPSPALITPFPADAFPNILTANIPTNIGKKPNFCSSDLFLIASPILLLVILILQVI